MSDENELTITATKATHGNHRVIARLGKTVLLTNEMKIGKIKDRDAFVKQVVKLNGGLADQRDTISDKLSELAAKDTEPPPVGPAEEAEPTAGELLEKMSDEVKDEAEKLLNDPDLMQRIVADVHALGVAGEDRLIQTVYIVGVSRLLPKPLAAIVQGPSSSGKSYVAEQTSKLMPPEGIIHASQMTPQSLFHMKPGRLRHRFILAGERSRKEDYDTAEATRALREMIGSGKLTKMMPMKVNGGTIETQVIEQGGPIGFLETTTLCRIMEEDRNRCILLSTDETPEQTQRISEAAAARAAGITGGNTDGIIERYHAMQRMIAMEPAKVIIPFAEKLSAAFGYEKLEVRRSLPHLLTAIEAVALLYQRQRERTENGTIIADLADYAIARNIFGHAIERSLGLVLSNGARRFLRRLRTRYSFENFKSTKAVADDTFGKTQVHGWLCELADQGLIVKVEDGAWTGNGRTAAVWRIVEDAYASIDTEDTAEPPLMLPPPESLA